MKTLLQNSKMKKKVFYTIFPTKFGVISFKRDLLLLAVFVTTKDPVSQYSIYNYLNNDN